MNNRAMNITDIWRELVEGLTLIYKTQDKVPPQRYMELYTLVFNFCTRASTEEATQSRPRNKGPNNPGGVSGAEFIGSELYERLKQFISLFVESLLNDCKDLNGEQLLEQYTTVWKKFQFSSTVVNGIFAYLNRHWIKREIDEGKTDVYEVYNLAVVTWKEIIFEHLNNNITSAILNLIKQERNGEMITTKLVSGVVESYIELGINEAEENAQPNAAGTARRANSKLAVYKTYFEKRFIEDTRNYYTQMENRINEEHDRCELYLEHSTQDPLAKTLNEVLISQHLELFQSEFGSLLVHRQDEDLGRMYSLCMRVTGALDQLKVILESHIERDGKQAIEKIATIANDPKQYVSTILAVHRRFSKLVMEAFRQDTGFVQAMDKAFTSFINNNQVTQAVKNTSKSPELLARYCDLLLRKSAKNPEEGEMEEMLNQVMVVFKYIEDKDVFQKFYSKMLAKRLVGDLSASDEAESNMIAKLKQMCGFEYTSKLQRMFTDAGLSKEISEKYKHHLQTTNKDDSVDFSIMVLASSVWPFSQSASFQIPTALSSSIEHFSEFYQLLHSGRKLSWLLMMCRGELTSHAFSRKYTFVASTAQMSILMHFNDQLEYTIDDLAELLKMKKDAIIPHLQSIVKVELIKLSTGETDLEMNASGSTVLQLNNAFTNKKLKVDLSKTLMRGEVKRENEEVQKTVEDDRRLVIQAAIVRIMKMRKTLKHTQLMSEVLQQLSSRFQPKVILIKKCIDILIEKDYIKRVENDKDSYEYLA